MTNKDLSPDTPVRVMSIQRFSLHDGPGIRTTVFLQGCPLRCPWCCNPESQSVTAGKEMTVGQIMTQVLRDRDYYKESEGGVTFSGGEVFMQPRGLLTLLADAHENHISTAVETCGQASKDWVKQAIPLTDLFLFDLKHSCAETLKHFTGADLETVLDNLRQLAPSGKVIGRIPCIPGFNLDEDTLRGIFSIARDNGLKEVHLLPYHTFGVDKYTRLGRQYSWSGDSVRKEALEPFAALGRSFGLDIKIGG